MGYDIHGVVEIHLNGEWQIAMDIADLSPRNYALFALLFGVRGQSPYEYKYRGMPKDRSWYTANRLCEECNGNGHHEADQEAKAIFLKYHPDETNCGQRGDYHSLSWVTIQEIERHWDEISSTIEVRRYRHDREWAFVFATMRYWENYLKENAVVIESTAALSTGQEDTSRVRMVVWFDN